MEKTHLTLDEIRIKKNQKNLEHEKNKKLAIRNEILEFMEHESEYTNRHKLFITNEIMFIINKHE